MMILEEMEQKRKADIDALKATTCDGGSDSLITKSEMRMTSSAEMMTTVNRVIVSEIPDAELEGKSEELSVERVELVKHLEAKVEAL